MNTDFSLYQNGRRLFLSLQPRFGYTDLTVTNKMVVQDDKNPNLKAVKAENAACTISFLIKIIKQT